MEVAKTDFKKFSPHTNFDATWGDGSVNFIVVSISQYMYTSNNYIVDLKLLQCNMSIISQWSWNKLKLKTKF